MSLSNAPIGVFDSGYGGLTILRELVAKLPEYDYLYLGDNARAPYGTRSFEAVYRYTLECVSWLIKQNCPLVILACNTASAKALQYIQRNDLEKLHPTAKVLGVLRPTTEVIGRYTGTNTIGILATQGTVRSKSYEKEISHYFPDVHIEQEACPMWVPLIENNEHHSEGADYFVHKHINNLLQKNSSIDTLLLACTHYPLLEDKIQQMLPKHVKLLSQGKIVADSLSQYLERHPEIDANVTKNGKRAFYTTDLAEEFSKKGTIFFGESVEVSHVEL